MRTIIFYNQQEDIIDMHGVVFGGTVRERLAILQLFDLGELETLLVHKSRAVGWRVSTSSHHVVVGFIGIEEFSYGELVQCCGRVTVKHHGE